MRQVMPTIAAAQLRMQHCCMPLPLALQRLLQGASQSRNRFCSHTQTLHPVLLDDLRQLMEVLHDVRCTRLRELRRKDMAFNCPPRASSSHRILPSGSVTKLA